MGFEVASAAATGKRDADGQILWQPQPLDGADAEGLRRNAGYTFEVVGSQSGKAAKRVCVDTLNGTTGKAAMDYVRSNLCKAAAICLQEITSVGE